MWVGGSSVIDTCRTSTSNALCRNDICPVYAVMYRIKSSSYVMKNFELLNVIKSAKTSRNRNTNFEISFWKRISRINNLIGWNFVLQLDQMCLIENVGLWFGSTRSVRTKSISMGGHRFQVVLMICGRSGTTIWEYVWRRFEIFTICDDVSEFYQWLVVFE